jgi:hypothetical protein
MPDVGLGVLDPVRVGAFLSEGELDGRLSGIRSLPQAESESSRMAKRPAECERRCST